MAVHIIPLDDERTLSIPQFCEIEGLTLDQFEGLEETECGPYVIDWFLGLGRRITPKSRRNWHKMIADWPGASGEHKDDAPVSET